MFGLSMEVIIAICVPIVILGSAWVFIVRDRRKGRDPLDGSSSNSTMDDTGF